MAKTVLVHSFRGGTGKSNTTANLATAIACMGQRVAVVDIDIQSPGIHVLFGLEPDCLKHTLNDYLWENCAIKDAVYDVSPDAVKQRNGRVFLLPSSCEVKDITRVLYEGYDLRRLKRGFRTLTEELDLDYVLVDTHPGLNEETLPVMELANILMVMLRSDHQDFQGTSVMLDVAQQLKVPKVAMVVNRALQHLDLDTVRYHIEAKYGVPVLGVLPNCDEMMQLASRDLFYLCYPDHLLSQVYQHVASQVMA